MLLLDDVVHILAWPPFAFLRFLLTAAFLFLITGCALADIPEDTVGTLEHVVDGVVFVGVAENPPWTILERDLDAPGGFVPGGVEVMLVQELADQMDADIIWVSGAQTDLLEALAERELDLVIAGFVAGSPALTDVSVTQGYYSEEIIVAVADSGDVFKDIAGREISVPLGSKTAALVTGEDGVAARVAELSPENAPLAAADWLVEHWGLYPTGIELEKREHVLAVPPGENAWIVEVERFLAAHRDEVDEWLVAHTRSSEGLE